MPINQVKQNFDEQTQKEMFSLVKHLASCEEFELEGLKVRAGQLIKSITRGGRI